MSAIINFSGGRTSGYMLHRMLEVGFPTDTHVVFCNTGKEHEGTLDFVRECALRWAVPIVWLEWSPEKPHFRQVSYETASRKGEPFAALTEKRKFLPNAKARFCTQEMKIKTEYRFARSLGWDEWDSYVGIRADEPRRAARLNARNDTGEERAEKVMPLVKWGITRKDVLSFWSNQPFDLGIPEGFGNCDMCFLKGRAVLQANAKASPERVAWWADQEDKRKATFVKHGVKYRDLLTAPACSINDAIEDCTCTD